MDKPAKTPDEKLIKDIAEYLDTGMVCFLNPQTLEVVYVPQNFLLDNFDADGEVFQEDLDKVDNEWESFIRIEPLESFETFRIMESFAEDVVTEEKLQKQLFSILGRRKPFRHFKDTIDYSDYREKWFAYKQEAIEKHVKRLLM